MTSISTKSLLVAASLIIASFVFAYSSVNASEDSMTVILENRESKQRFQSTVSLPSYSLTAFRLNNATAVGLGDKYLVAPDYALKVSPNPMTTTGTVSFQLIENAAIELYLLDGVGMNVLNIATQTLDKGPHSFPFSVSGINPGLYYCVLKIGKNRIIKKVVVSQ